MQTRPLAAASASEPVRRPRRLLVEQPGPWGSSGDPRDSRMPAPLADELVAWAAATGTRLHLIRRGPRSRGPGERTCLVVSPGQASPAIRRHLVDDPRRILERLEAETGRRPEPVVVVPAAPVARLPWRRVDPPLLAAARAAGADAWEITGLDTGGVPAALAVLPEAALYVGVGPASVPSIVAAHARGEVAPAWWRGREGDPWDVRAAEARLRHSTGRLGPTDVMAVAVRRLNEGESVVRVALRGAGAVEVHLRRAGTPAAGRQPAGQAEAEVVALRTVALGAARPALARRVA